MNAEDDIDVPTTPPPPLTTSAALLEDGSDRRLRRLIDDLMLVSRRLGEVRHELAARVGLDGPCYRVLAVVVYWPADWEAARPDAARARAPGSSAGGVAVKRVAELLGVTGVTVTNSANALVARGLVEKRPDPADGRSVLLAPTAAGRALIDEVEPFVLGAHNVLFDGLSADEFRTLASVMRRVAATATSSRGILRKMGRRRPLRTYAQLQAYASDLGVLERPPPPARITMPRGVLRRSPDKRPAEPEMRIMTLDAWEKRQRKKKKAPPTAE